MTLKELLKSVNIILDSGKTSSRIRTILKKYPEIKQQIFDATSFVEDKSDNSLKERMFLIKNDIHKPVFCVHCNSNRVKFIKDGKHGNKYSKHCSLKCANNDLQVKEKKKKTNKKHYGVDNPFSSEKIKEKIKKSNLTKYGVENPMQSGKIQEKVRLTNIKKYGVVYPHQNAEVKEKFSITMQSRYGVKHALQNKDIKIKQEDTMIQRFGSKHALQNEKIHNQLKKSNKEKYGVECTLEDTNTKEKIKQTNLERYGVDNPFHNKKVLDRIKTQNIKTLGVEYPFQSSNILKKANSTLKEKYGVDNIKHAHISSNTLMILNDKKWLYENHYNKRKSLTEIGKELGINRTTVHNYLVKHGLETQIYFQSQGEKEISNYIQSLCVEVETNNRKLIYPYEIDIYIPQHQLAIEYCGLYWHSEHAGKDKNYHLEKLNLCNQKGIRLITIFEDEWLDKPKIVKSKIRNILNIPDTRRIYARKTFVVSLSKQEKDIFFNDNHIQGTGPGSISYGLSYDDEIVAAITFIQQTNGSFILNRYATSCSIVGGFSKLLNYFQKNNEWKKILSFADLRWSEGNLYEKTGWILEKTLSPDYYYIYANQRMHKFNFRHKNLRKLLPTYDPTLTEKQNCSNAGIPRIWNCGLKRYLLKN